MWQLCRKHGIPKKAIHKIQQKENIQNFDCLTQIKKTKETEKNPTHSLHGKFLLWKKKKKNSQLDK